ncbi:MAG: hypothetical protein J7M25_10220, partial [Deltaproteobacteria bacterium]|nr:hypothetical protein [Deltaproteobacteria bacterium]
RKNEHITEALIYTALIRLAVSRVAMDTLCERVLRSAEQNRGQGPPRRPGIRDGEEVLTQALPQGLEHLWVGPAHRGPTQGGDTVEA